MLLDPQRANIPESVAYRTRRPSDLFVRQPIVLLLSRLQMLASGSGAGQFGWRRSATVVQLEELSQLKRRTGKQVNRAAATDRPAQAHTVAREEHKVINQLFHVAYLFTLTE